MKELPIRRWVAGLVLVTALGLLPGLAAQTSQSQTETGQSGQTKPEAVQNDNPFPSEPTKGQEAKPRPDAGKPDAPKPAQEDNPFPGETSDVPVIPVDPGPVPVPRSNANREAEDGGKAAAGSSDLDGDPVKSPDGAGMPTDDGFSSSRSGLKQMPVEDDTESTPGKSGKKKTREQVLKEDVDIGNFYLDRKNWKAAQGRFEAAFALNAENPDAVWGLAEAERHLNLNEKAREHYQLFLTYDAEGPHGKAARKALEQMEGAGRGSMPPK